MADVYMHAKLAKEVISELGKDVQDNLLTLGAQGPDPMYYGFVHSYHDRYKFIADRMHDTETNKLFKSFLSYIKDHPSNEVYSYMAGFLCHFALDVSIHPYVYYKVGQYKKEDPSTHHMRGLHLKFERSIDAALIEYDIGKKAHKFPIQPYTFPTKKPPKELIDLYQHVMKDRYQFEEGGQMFMHSVQSMYRVLKYIVRDRTGLKKQFYKILNKIFHKEDMFFSDLSMFHHLEDYDYLNQTNTSWLHPATKEKFYKSVFDLYLDAKDLAKDLIQYLDAYIQGQENKSIEEVFQNLSFNSGIDCADKRPMMHYNIYRK